MSKNKQVLVIYLALTVIPLLAFWQVNRCKFINYDDPTYVAKNSHIQQGITAEGLRWAATTGYAANWHPLTWLSHMLDVQLFGSDPSWHHATNLVIHIANTLLLFLVLYRLTKAHWQSAFVAALFALHPLHVESVAWVAERKDVLSAFFWLLTMGAYSSYVQRPGTQRYLMVLVFYILGLMAKPMLVTLPFVLLLLDYWPLRRFQLGQAAEGAVSRAVTPLPENRRKEKRKKHPAGQGRPDALTYANEQGRPVLFFLREKIPFFLFAILSSVVTYVVQQKGGAMSMIETYPFALRTSNALISYFVYLGKMVWPSGLAPFYPYQWSWKLWQVLGILLLLAAATAAVLGAAKRFPYLPVGWLWYLGTLVPVIGIVQVGLQARADRYTYIPLIGIFIMIAWGVPELLKRWRYRKEVLFSLSACVLSSLFIITRTQVGYWQNSITLFEHAVNVTEKNFLAYFSIGEVYADAGDQTRAIEQYDRSIEANPKYAAAYYNRGNAYAVLGNRMQAIKDYTKVIELIPDDVETYTNRGNAYIAIGNYQQALQDYSKIIEVSPKLAYAYFMSGVAYGRLGDLSRAVDNYDKAIEINPRYAEAYSNRGAAYGRLGNRRQALEDVRTAARLGNEIAQDMLRRLGETW